MNELQIFENKEFGEIRTIWEDGKSLFCGSDAARALGYADTVNALKQHCKEDGMAFHHIIDSLGRKQNAKFIDEGNLYRLITHSQLPSAEKFEQWVFDEVLPSIRKHGMYATPDKIEAMLADPDTMIRTLEALKEERKLRQEAEQYIEEEKPYSELGHLHSVSKDDLTITEFAMSLANIGIDTGRNRIYGQLRKLNIIRPHERLPYQPYVTRGIFHLKMNPFTLPDGTTHTNPTPMVTPRGQLYLKRKVELAYGLKN